LRRSIKKESSNSSKRRFSMKIRLSPRSMKSTSSIWVHKDSLGPRWSRHPREEREITICRLQDHPLVNLCWAKL
jgi:hypothetical protein